MSALAHVLTSRIEIRNSDFLGRINLMTLDSWPGQTSLLPPFWQWSASPLAKPTSLWPGTTGTRSGSRMQTPAITTTVARARLPRALPSGKEKSERSTGPSSWTAWPGSVGKTRSSRSWTTYISAPMVFTAKTRVKWYPV